MVMAHHYNIRKYQVRHNGSTGVIIVYIFTKLLKKHGVPDKVLGFDKKLIATRKLSVCCQPY